MTYVRSHIEAGIGTLTLDRPEALNALTDATMVALKDALTSWAADDTVTAVRILGEGSRGFCAGADVRALRTAVLAGDDLPDRFFATEYEVNALIASYPKPLVAVMHGITFGGGLGLSAHASDRIVHPDAHLAMPEVGIGLYPDVGLLWQLSRMPDEVGTYLALTGLPIGAEDAMTYGLADAWEGAGLPEGERLETSWFSLLAGDDVVAIVRRLEAGPPAARAAAALIRTRCPMSVWVSLIALRRAAGMSSVDEVLAQDARLAPRMVRRDDFCEGVRAQLVDKDRRPRWSHARVEDVRTVDIDALFR